MIQLKSVWSIAKKDLLVLIRNPVRIAVTIIPSLVVLLILVLQGASVQGSPIAVVNLDRGEAAQQLVSDVKHYDGFLSAAVMTPAQAKAAYDRLHVSAVLTIPAGFSKALRTGKQPVVTWRVRNFNDDTANDLRRAMPDVIHGFIRRISAGADPIRIHFSETDTHASDAGFISFQLVAVLVVLLLQASTVNAGLAAVNEWESGSIKELLISPASALSVVCGKIIAGVVASDIAGAITAGIAWACGLLPGVTAAGALLALLAATLLAFFGSGIGVALGSAFRVTEKTSLSSILISFYLFFLSGGIVALAYLPAWVQAVARIIPNTYAVDALRNTLLYGSYTGVAGDLRILLIASIAGLLIGIPAMRRGLPH